MRNRLLVRVVAAGLMLLVVVVASGCHRRVGFVGTNVPGHIEASYISYTGEAKREVDMEVGDTLHIEYLMVVEEGRLSIKVMDPDENVLKRLDATSRDDRREGTLTVEAPVGGEYLIVVRGELTRGQYDVSWEVQ